MVSRWMTLLSRIAAVPLLWPATSRAEACPLRVTAADLPRCALAASLDVRAQAHALAAAQQRKNVASVALPSWPQLAVAAGVRTAAQDGGSQTGPSTAWTLGLAQEFELGGQRHARIDAAQAGVDAEQQRATALRPLVLAAAWTVWYQVLLRRDAWDLAQVDAAALQAVAAAVRARADKGVAALVDAEMADAAAVDGERARIQAEQQLREARVDLTLILGEPADAGTDADGRLEPLAVDATRTTIPADVLALRAESRALIARADAIGRSRTPNLTVSAQAQHDRSGETAWLVGAAVPLQLPGALARNYAAEAGELQAAAQRLQVEAELLDRKWQAAMAVARQDLTARQAELALYPVDRLDRARQLLVQLAQNVARGQLGVRDALQARQSLVGLLRGELAARAAVCLASVELARRTGSLERSVP
ncbi:MAG: TolC family protein [Deltaproteobacteria bacterium]|nr:TolC family protein [Deltaproteobacteria bacterium]